jgi:hypothetical protein
MYDQPQACPLTNPAIDSVVFVASLFVFYHDSDVDMAFLDSANL